MIITVDGLPASGKGSLARALAAEFNLPVLETGSLWRVLALDLMSWFGADHNFSVDDSYVRDRAFEVMADFPINNLHAPQLRIERVGEVASIISGNKEIRGWVDEIQKDWVATPGGGILDGRETGISIAPNADHKFFLTADVMRRARWRASQVDQNYADVLDGLRVRDYREINRDVSPIRPAPDAVIIDTGDFVNVHAVLAHAKRSIAMRQTWAATLKMNRINT